MPLEQRRVAQVLGQPPAEIAVLPALDALAQPLVEHLRDGFRASDGRFIDCFVRAARDNGLGAHVGGRSMEISDDHDAFMAVNVRSVDLIDFDYGPNNWFWHTKDDTLANCSKQSLDVFGRITLLGLSELEAQLRG